MPATSQTLAESDGQVAVLLPVGSHTQQGKDSRHPRMPKGDAVLCLLPCGAVSSVNFGLTSPTQSEQTLQLCVPPLPCA